MVLKWDQRRAYAAMPFLPACGATVWIRLSSGALDRLCACRADDKSFKSQLRKPASSPFSPAKQQSRQGEQAFAPALQVPKHPKPGKRAPGRDSTGSEVLPERMDEGQAAG